PRSGQGYGATAHREYLPHQGPAAYGVLFLRGALSDQRGVRNRDRACFAYWLLAHVRGLLVNPSVSTYIANWVGAIVLTVGLPERTISSSIWRIGGAVTSACIPQTELLYFASAGHDVSRERV